MASLRLKPYQSLLTAAFVLGCLPGLIILLLVRIQEGDLMMFGQGLGPGNMPRILAAVLSPSAPLLLMMPLALATLPPQVRGAFIGPAILAPVMFVLPTILASFLVGARGFSPTLQAVLLLVAFNVCFCLWFRILKRLLPIFLAVLLYGCFWASSGFFDYIANYVAPHQDFWGLNIAVAANWVLPQMGTAFNHIDTLLTGQAWPWRALMPTLIQLPVLIGLSVFLPLRDSDRFGHG